MHYLAGDELVELGAGNFIYLPRGVRSRSGSTGRDRPATSPWPSPAG